MRIFGNFHKIISFLGLPLALACSPDPPSLDSLADNAIVSQTDTETKGIDRDDEASTGEAQDTVVEDEASPLDVHFLFKEMALSEADDGCDLDDDGQLDNSFGKMLERFAPMMPGDVDPNAGLDQAISEGLLLMALSVLGVDDFETDDEVTLEFRRAELEDPEAAPPEDLFSGYGSAVFVDPPHSVIEGASLQNGRLTTPKSEVVLEIPMGDQAMEMTVELAHITAKMDAVLDGDRVVGALTEGKICGAIDKDDLKDKISALVGNNKMIASVIGKFLNQNADVRCNGKPKQCLSMAMDFSALTVEPL